MDKCLQDYNYYGAVAHLTMPKLHPSHDSAKCKICNQVPQSVNKLINCINIFSELTLSILYIKGIDIKKIKIFFYQLQENSDGLLYNTV